MNNVFRCLDEAVNGEEIQNNPKRSEVALNEETETNPALKKYVSNTKQMVENSRGETQRVNYLRHSRASSIRSQK